MDEQLVKTVARMRRCASIVEDELKAALALADKMAVGFTFPVADVLVRYVEDAANVPLRVAMHVSSAAAMRSAVDALADVLREVEPWHLRGDFYLRRAMSRTAAVVRRRRLPTECAAEYQLFVAETAAAFRGLEDLAKGQADKQRSTARFLHALRRFARSSWYAIVCLSFNALKLAVCTRALGEVGGRSSLPPRQLRRLARNLGRLGADHPRAAAALPDLFEEGLSETRRLVDEHWSADDVAEDKGWSQHSEEAWGGWTGGHERTKTAEWTESSRATDPDEDGSSQDATEESEDVPVRATRSDRKQRRSKGRLPKGPRWGGA